MNSTEDYLIKKYHNTGLFDIEQKDLVYSDYYPAYGMQCNHDGGTPEYKEIAKLCHKIIDLIKKIDKLNTLKK